VDIARIVRHHLNKLGLEQKGLGGCRSSRRILYFSVAGQLGPHARAERFPFPARARAPICKSWRFEGRPSGSAALPRGSGPAVRGIAWRGHQ